VPNPSSAPRAFRLPSALAAFALLGTAFLPAAVRAADDDRWAATVSRVADSVVSLKLAQLRSFDDVDQGNSSATGFVVDAERGIVLTNRHVVGSGPIRVSATFQNQERVDAVPLYRDPIHDFAFVRYDPATLRYAEPDSLALRPDKVATGMNIRVIGSDGGEQLSILPGTIARLDREVPSYGRYGYNDFNTFYYQAASGTSGGSSGSPVIDFDGDVVALNAAANTRTASSFFLPLPRILHALERLQRGEPIDRGGLQTLFVHQPFRELARLGLAADTETRVRAADGGNGLLVARQIIPGGVADGLLEPGDILISVDGEVITGFVDLEALLDDKVDRTVSLDIARQGEALTLELRVADLNALAPSRFVELGDAVVQDMSIQHARAMNRAQAGVVVMRPGYFFSRENVPEGAVIVALDGQPIDGLDSFLDAIAAADDRRRMRIRYIVPGNEFKPAVARFGVDERWFGHRDCLRVDDARFWRCEEVSLPVAAEVSPVQGPSRVPGYGDALLDAVAPAMVHVDFHIPYPADNVYARHFTGVGLIVDAERGLVAVDRNTVPIGLGDAELTFLGAHLLPARVVFLHPRHNVALLAYDPAALGDIALPELALAGPDDEIPDALTMVGLRADGTFRRARVDELGRLTVGFPPPGLPRFQQSALDVYGVSELPPSLGGPLVDERGVAHALYASFAYEEDREIRQAEWAMPIALVREALALHTSGEALRSLDVALAYRPLVEARRLGLPDTWLERYDALPAASRRVLYVQATTPGTDAAERFAAGDILLALDGVLVADLLEVERLAQADRVAATVLRDGAVRELEVVPSASDALGTERMVSWAGALFQMPHAAIAEQKGVDVEGVYIAYTADGSPALWDRLWRNRFVVAVDGEAVTDLDRFLALVRDRPEDEVTRLTVVSMSGRRNIVTVEPEYRFWPTYEIRRGADGWERLDHPARAALSE